MSEVEKALARLEEVARQGAAPSHYLARHLLLSLGAALREGHQAPIEAWLERARRAGAAAGPRWSEAVQSELAMACAEFTQCVDPRYLSVPGYDRAYTRAARARLADRFSAARALELPPSERDQEMVALADEVWAAFEARSTQAP